MRDFAELFLKLDQTNKSSIKIEALVDYFENASDKDKVWLVAFFSGKRPKRTIQTSLLKKWIIEISNIPEWLFIDSYHVVGDLAETISLLIPFENETYSQSLDDTVRAIQDLKVLDDLQKKEIVLKAWKSMSKEEAFIFNKLITGGFRLGVSQKTIVKALATFLKKEENTVAHRLMGNWDPFEISFEKLLIAEHNDDDISRPYPFYLAYALETEIENLGPIENWLAERKWDGIRGQIILRENQIFVWSRGEELVTEKYPEFNEFPKVIGRNCVLDGEILAFKDSEPLNFNELQTRIGRKNLSAALLRKTPVVFMVYDILEIDNLDIRNKQLKERRGILNELLEAVNSNNLILSSSLQFDSWQDLARERENSRVHHCEGLMLKHKESTYKIGRKKGDWWKWKVDPLTIDAVLIYAMRGHGRRANLYTDYTFGVWNDNGELLSFTKAYSGLTDLELKEVDRYVKKNTIDRFGPVRSVVPKLVFEIAFEGIAKSTRHKSGVALRFPRILRWRKDKSAKEANSLQDLQQMLNSYGNK